MQGERSRAAETIATGPFSAHGAAEYRVSEFLPSMAADVLAAFREA